MQKRLFIFGIDGTPYRLMKEYSDKGIMPNFKKLREQYSIFCKMKSSIPDISSVSWSTIISGKNPGEHGVYGFIDLIPETYDLTFPNFATMKEKAYWQRDDKKKHVIINIPSTYPAKPMNGYHVSGFVSLDLDKATFPGKFLGELKTANYRIDVDSGLGHTDKGLFIKDLFETLDIRTKIGLQVWAEIDWDTFFFVVTGSDRIGHFLFKAFEDENHKYHEQFKEYFRKIDESLGKFLEKLNPEDSIILLSDHGMEKIKKQVYVNVYLQQEGFLQLEGEKTYNNIKAESKAFALNPGRIYVHVEGKYPKGTVKEEEKEEVIKELIKAFDKLEFEGEKVINKIYRKEKIYNGREIDKAPDLVLMSNSGFNLKGSLQKDVIFENDIFEGKHTYDDSFFFLKTNKEIKLPEEFSVQDVLGIMDKIL